MKQNEESLVFFNKKEPIYFELLEYAFDGSIYNTIVESKQHGLSVTKEKNKSKKKEKNNSVTEDSYQVIKAQKQVEVPSTATLKLKNVTNSDEFNIQIVCDSSKNAQSINFKIKIPILTSLLAISKSNIEQLKEYKELLDLDILSQEEFNKKKVEILNL